MIDKIRNAQSQKELMDICNQGLKLSKRREDQVEPKDWDEFFLVLINNGNAIFRDSIIQLKDKMKPYALERLKKGLLDKDKSTKSQINYINDYIVDGLLCVFLNHIIESGLSWSKDSRVSEMINNFADSIEKIKKTGVVFEIPDNKK